MVELNHRALADRYGWGVPIEELRRQLTCQECGRQADRLMLGHEQAAVPELRFDKDERGLP